MVAEHVPAAWLVASPAQLLAARERAVDRMYRPQTLGITTVAPPAPRE